MGSSPVASTNFAKQALFACLAFLLLFKPQKANLRFGAVWRRFHRQEGEFCDARVLPSLLRRCRSLQVPSPRPHRRNSTFFNRERLLPLSVVLCRFLLSPKARLSGAPPQALFACLAFLLLFKPQKANLRFGAVWRRFHRQEGEFCDARVLPSLLRRCRSLQVPSPRPKNGVKRLVLPLFC